MTGALKIIAQWLMYAALIAAAAAAMLLGKADTVLVERLRAHTADVFAPILGIISRPVDAAAKAVDRARELILLTEENEQLRQERDLLLQWQAVAQRLEAENTELRQLLKVAADPDAHFVTARVVADPGGTFAHALLLNAGSRSGVARGQVVVTSEGLVGRIAGVSPRVSRVILVTDLNSRVPAIAGDAETRAVLAGDNTDLPKLIHRDPGATIAVGDRVMTSSVTGAFPPGLPVGVVVSIDDGIAAVAPFFKRSRLEFVRVIDHQLPKVVEEFVRSAPRPRAPQPAGRAANE
jgi:rod shape-determining protein MreC